MNPFEKNLKIHEIFWPFGFNQRSKQYNSPQIGDNPYARFVHYTSAEAALSIIQSRRIWMRNSKCMADYSEVQHGFNILREFLADLDRRKLFIETLDSYFPRAANDAIKLFDGWWNDINLNTFITSISEHGENEDKLGRLSMWRSFGGKTARVAIVLKIPWYMESKLESNLIFSPVAYLSKEESHKEFSTIIDNIKNNQEFIKTLSREEFIGAIFNTFLSSAACLKHEAFREEREWRVLYAPNRTPSSLIESGIETVSGVPQQIYKIPLDSEALEPLSIPRIFDRLIIGPSPYPWAMYQAFTTALKEAKVPDPIVWTSDIPLRA